MTHYYCFFEYHFLSTGIVSFQERIILLDILHPRNEFINLVKTKYPESTENYGMFKQAVQQIKGYMDGNITAFSLPCSLTGTAFQKEVLRKTADIPYGRVSTYRQIAHSMGNPGALRAVGGALARNPLPLIIPCHRVIRSNGSPGGFGGGMGKGVDIKLKLLSLEGIKLGMFRRK
ncbi:MAG: methylated-DNA--[protein]-cysteine S-methyltransferase [Spirochaetota bacterium]